MRFVFSNQWKVLQIFQDSFCKDNIGQECIFQAFIDPRIQNFGSYSATSRIYWIHYKPPVLSYLKVVTYDFSYVSLLRKLDFPLRCFLVNVFFLWICSHLLKKSSTESFNFCAVFLFVLTLQKMKGNMDLIWSVYSATSMEYVNIRGEFKYFCKALHLRCLTEF